MKVLVNLCVQMRRLGCGSQDLQARIAGLPLSQDQTVFLHQLQNAGGCGTAQSESALHITLEYRPVNAFHKDVMHYAALHPSNASTLHIGVHSLFQLSRQDINPHSTVFFH